MSWWDFKNIGAWAKPQDVEQVKKIFGYFGYTEEWIYYDDADIGGSYYNGDPKCPNVYVNVRDGRHWYLSDTILDNVDEYVDCSVAEFLYILLNELFSGVSILEEWSKGNTVSGDLEGAYHKYDANTLTVESRYVRRCDDESAEEDSRDTSKITLSLTMIDRDNVDFLECLVELASADGNEELAAKITELVERVKAANEVE